MAVTLTLTQRDLMLIDVAARKVTMAADLGRLNAKRAGDETAEKECDDICGAYRLLRMKLAQHRADTM